VGKTKRGKGTKLKVLAIAEQRFHFITQRLIPFTSALKVSRARFGLEPECRMVEFLDLLIALRLHHSLLRCQPEIALISSDVDSTFCGG
jgi:hypothetical protein